MTENFILHAGIFWKCDSPQWFIPWFIANVQRFRDAKATRSLQVLTTVPILVTILHGTKADSLLFTCAPRRSRLYAPVFLTASIPMSSVPNPGKLHEIQKYRMVRVYPRVDPTEAEIVTSFQLSPGSPYIWGVRCLY